MTTSNPRTERTHNLKLSAFESISLRFFRGTGQYVGKDARMRTRQMRGQTLRTLLNLRKKGLLEHFCAGQWYLTDEGRDYLAGRIAR